MHFRVSLNLSHSKYFGPLWSTVTNTVSPVCVSSVANSPMLVDAVKPMAATFVVVGRIKIAKGDNAHTTSPSLLDVVRSVGYGLPYRHFVVIGGTRGCRPGFGFEAIVFKYRHCFGTNLISL